MGPGALLLLLSGILVLTETLAGECGVGRERPLRGGARGPPGSLGGSNPGTERPRRPCPDPPPPRIPACPFLLPDPSFLPLSKIVPVFDLFHLTGPPPPPPSRPHHLGPGTRAGRSVGPGLTPPRPQAPTP